MLYSFTNYSQLQPLPAIEGLYIQETKDLLLMASIGQLSPEQTAKRFAGGHKAYVAYLHDVPAAFGWVATEKARIGELNHEFALPPHHLYLWNFRTLLEFRGLGIYPHLLQYILTVEQPNAECLWIMHAPENRASQRGILKAGFSFVGKVSVTNGSEVIFTSGSEAMLLENVLDTFGFQKTEEEQATCWNCSSPYIAKRQPTCCCSANNTECSINIYEMKGAVA